MGSIVIPQMYKLRNDPPRLGRPMRKVVRASAGAGGSGDGGICSAIVLVLVLVLDL
jgi:hypothetical protein